MRTQICQHCGERIPDWDMCGKSCLTCYEQYERPKAASQEEQEVEV